MDDYQDAAKRHLDDAELLFSQESPRLANASHLFGISAECSLKAIAQKLKPDKKFCRKEGHMPLLFSELCNIAQTSGDLATQINGLKLSFANWTVNQRYESQSTFQPKIVSKEQSGAKNAHLLMTNCLQGLI